MSLLGDIEGTVSNVGNEIESSPVLSDLETAENSVEAAGSSVENAVGDLRNGSIGNAVGDLGSAAVSVTNAGGDLGSAAVSTAVTADKVARTAEVGAVLTVESAADDGTRAFDDGTGALADG